jgi:ribosomal protein S18 acetylase RimI-like enzyme
MKIRKAKINDVNKILKLLNNEPRLSMDRNINSYNIEDVKEYIKSKINVSLVYESDNLIIGFITAQFWKTYAYLHLIVVDKNFQGKGIGTALMKKIELIAKKRNLDTIESITEIKNDKMQGIFNKFNYKKGEEFIAFIKKI